MRIVSKYKDYYDIGASAGVDMSTVYVRETQDIIGHIKPENPYAYSKWGSDRNYDYRPSGWSKFIIGFCGKTYPGIQKWVHTTPYGGRREVLYNLDAVHEMLAGEIKQDKSKNVIWHRRHHMSEYDKFFEDYSKPNHLYKVFEEYNVPIFVKYFSSYCDLLQLNPLLRSWEFFKVVDPWTAFQEISMYVGGVLNGPTMPVPSISDDVMVEIKGFDKWSFRKEPKTKP